MVMLNFGRETSEKYKVSAGNRTATLNFQAEHLDRFHLELFACFHSLQIGGELASEIKHGHSPVDIVVLDPRYD